MESASLASAVPRDKDPHVHKPISRALITVLAAMLAFALAAPAVSTGAPPAPRHAPSVLQADSTSLEPTRVVVQYVSRTPKAARAGALAAAGLLTISAVEPGHDMQVAGPRPGETAIAAAERLSKQPGVRWAIPDRQVHALGMQVPPNDPYYLSGSPNQQRYLGSRADARYGIDLEPAWNQAFNGADHQMDPFREGARIAVIDTGYQSTSNESIPLDIIPVWNYIANNNNPTDDNNHGTWVTMTLRANTNNSTGIAGVLGAGTSKIMVYKALDSTGVGWDSEVMAAIERAADDGAKVINLSLGEPATADPSQKSAWDSAVAYAQSKGAIVVAAAGNDGSGGGVSYPAAAAGALAVGATDPDTGVRAYYSNYGTGLDLVAPGGNFGNTFPFFAHPILVFSRDPGSVQQAYGTSFASPIAAGSLAFLWSLMPAASLDEMTSTVLATCFTALPGYDTTHFGAGEIDVWAAYQHMEPLHPTLPSITVTATPVRSFATTVTWTPPGSGSGLAYAFGFDGGTTSYTSANTGRITFSTDGTYTIRVKAYATDGWPSTDATCEVAFHGTVGPLVTDRIGGATRYGTAAAATARAFPSGATTVVVASGENWPDALSAGVLARECDGPLLLTRTNSLPMETAAEIQALHATRIVIIGGTPAISHAVQNALAAFGPVTRIGGSDRYDTAARVATRVEQLHGGHVPNGTVVIASGEAYADALAASPMAAREGWPILLTRATSLPGFTSTALSSLGATNTILVGGTPAVSGLVESQLTNPNRLSGPTKYDTALAVADYAVAHGAGTGGDLGVATGKNFPDALSGSVLMARRGGPLVLVDTYTSTLDAWLLSRGPSTTRLDVFGSPNVVPASTVTHIQGALRP